MWGVKCFVTTAVGKEAVKVTFMILVSLKTLCRNHSCTVELRLAFHQRKQDDLARFFDLVVL